MVHEKNAFLLEVHEKKIYLKVFLFLLKVQGKNTQQIILRKELFKLEVKVLPLYSSVHPVKAAVLDEVTAKPTSPGQRLSILIVHFVPAVDKHHTRHSFDIWVYMLQTYGNTRVPYVTLELNLLSLHFYTYN